VAEGATPSGVVHGAVAATGGAGPAPTTTAPSGPGTPAGAPSGTTRSGPSTSGPAGTTSGPNCSASANGGATDVGVTAGRIRIGNITSITGVAPNLTKSAQQATEAVAAYLNSQGGICGRQLTVDAFDDGNTSSGSYASAQQACGQDFALVGDASGFDDGSASAVQGCGLPDVSAENSTQAATNTADIFGANPGDLTAWPEGPSNWLVRTYPAAAKHAAMIYLNVPATVEQAQDEMKVYTSAGFDYIYTAAVSPTEPNYTPYVEKMQSAGVQYVTEYSDDNSAARLSIAMQQAAYVPQVTDWIAEMYSPAFLVETNGTAVGDLVELTSASYEDPADPGMALMETWMNRVAPGWTHDIFAEFAWSAGLLFAQAARAVGPHLTRTALLARLKGTGSWDGGGVQPPVQSIGQKIGSPCFAYVKITGNGYTRLYPSAPDTYDCSGGLYRF